MGLRWRRGDGRGPDGVASARWQETAAAVDQRFDELDRLPFDQVVDTVLEVVPQHLSREQLTERMARRRMAGTDPV